MNQGTVVQLKDAAELVGLKKRILELEGALIQCRSWIGASRCSVEDDEVALEQWEWVTALLQGTVQPEPKTNLSGEPDTEKTDEEALELLQELRGLISRVEVQGAVPEPLWDIKALATFFGVSQGRSYEIAKTPGFPSTVAAVGLGKRWFSHEVIEWTARNREKQRLTNRDKGRVTVLKR